MKTTHVNPHSKHDLGHYSSASSPNRKGFALIATISVMSLLVMIALAMLSLSVTELRSSRSGDAMAEAQANARMALMIAIGELQKEAGPDQRVTATADQLVGNDPSVSVAPQDQRQWVGIYQSWAEGQPGDARPAPEFRRWLVSGDVGDVSGRNYAKTQITAESMEIVTEKSVGSTGDVVRVPLVSQISPDGTKSNFAWWISDLGAKALMGPAKELPVSIADTRTDQQVAPALNLNSATSSGGVQPFENLDPTDSLLEKVASLQTSEIFADNPTSVNGLFHDFTAYSRGLLTNVRSGGFRKDLSLYLGGATAPRDPLFTVGGETGINMEELWTYYNLYKELQEGSVTYTTGGSSSSSSRYLRMPRDVEASKTDQFFHYKQPAIISYQVAFSFMTVPSGTRHRIRLVADPIITYWNPFDVPVEIPTTLFNTVEYWQLPYDLTMNVGGVRHKKSLKWFLRNGSSPHYMTLRAGKTDPIILKPGEVLKISQAAATMTSAPQTKWGNTLIEGVSGFNYGGGFSYDTGVNINTGQSFTYEMTPNTHSFASGVSSYVSMTHVSLYVGMESTFTDEPGLGIGGVGVDYLFGNTRLKPSDGERARGTQATKPGTDRFLATTYPEVFGEITPADGRSLNAPLNTKAPFMLYSYSVKTEKDSSLGGKFLSRYNPKAHFMDFYDLSEAERDLQPFELVMEPLNDWSDAISLDVSANGSGYFGGSMGSADGSKFVITHSVPREPVYSLAALQHSSANGFLFQTPRSGDYRMFASNREPLLPQISHAIGNSFASSVIKSDETEGTLTGGRRLADHSYLANQALWDNWFFSGIAPQITDSFSQRRDMKEVAEEFLNGTKLLPVKRYLPDLGGETASDILATLISGNEPAADGYNLTASLIEVDGMFNVNSTSVEAWKSLLGALKERPVITQTSTGAESSAQTSTGKTPVAGLGTPRDLISESGVDLTDSAQWQGRRTLSDPEINSLAEAIVQEVRKRGPFLSLADFVNRRVGSDKSLARSGAIQSALDNIESVEINKDFLEGARAVTSAIAGRFPFKEAEEGAAAQGIPGIVKQADILTPIAPILSVRSDTFMIRAYGEKADKTGKILARAWCEAILQRSPEFIDPVDSPTADYNTINLTNQKLGRRFKIVSFRWLSGSEV